MVENQIVISFFKTFLKTTTSVNVELQFGFEYIKLLIVKHKCTMLMPLT